MDCFKFASYVYFDLGKNIPEITDFICYFYFFFKCSLQIAHTQKSLGLSVYQQNDLPNHK